MIKYDSSKKAIINPADFVSPIDNMPDIAIACYSHILFANILKHYNCIEIGSLNYTDSLKKIYSLEYKNKKYALFMISVGGAAAATCIEDLHQMGCNKFVVFGNCGVIKDDILDLSIIIPTKAIRDEGVSFHYKEESLMLDVNHKYRDIFKDILNSKGYSYIEGITWTTDSFYRETEKRVKIAKEYGAICVEMEVASIQAVCDFRGIDLFTFFYAADNLANDIWDKRSLLGESKLPEKLQVVDLVMEFVNNI